MGYQSLGRAVSTPVTCDDGAELPFDTYLALYKYCDKYLRIAEDSGELLALYYVQCLFFITVFDCCKDNHGNHSEKINVVQLQSAHTPTDNNQNLQR